MNLIIDVLHDSITISAQIGKKGEAFNVVKNFEFPFTTISSIENALNEALTNDLIDRFKEDKMNSLIFGDDIVAFGIEELPVLSKSKVADVFETRFKMYFPNYNDYFLKYNEIERNKDFVKIFYAIAKRQTFNKLLNVIRAKGIEIKNIDYYSSFFAKQHFSEVQFPIATLIIGKGRSEIFISKGPQVFGVSILPMGLDMLIEKDNYLASPYNLNNDESLKFAACVKANFAANLALTDEKVLSYEKEDGLTFSIPREVRAIKGTSLENYNLKNNFRKFTAMIGDFIDNYSQAPWFMPIQEIATFGADDIFDLLDSSTQDASFKYMKATEDLSALHFASVENNDLFAQEFKEKRRKIDWAKFFTMEIGKKKKA